MINSVCGIRSTGRICTDLAEILEGQGHECKIAYGRESVPEKYQKYSIRIGNEASVRLNALSTRLFDNEGCNAIIATKKLIKKIKEYNPDVIHLHNLHGYYINVGLLFEYFKKSNKKIVWTLHDCWAFTGHCPCFDSISCDKWKTGCYKCPLHKDYPKSYIDRSKSMYKLKREWFKDVKNMTLVTPSQWLADLVKQSFLKEYPVKIINNGIDLSVFKPTESNFRERYNLQDKKIVLGVASAWGDSKGLKDFFKLADVLDDNYKIVLVGLTEEQKKELPEKIIGITRTNSVTELAQIYTAADVFVNLTYQDNYPTVNLEAQACGTPVITYKTGGSVESVLQNYWVKQGDLKGVVAAISKICSSDNKMAHIYPVGKFDGRIRCLEYIKLYEQLYVQKV